MSDQEASNNRATRRYRVNVAQLVAYLMILVVGVFGFWELERITDELHISQSCTEKFLTSTVEVADSRTNITGDVQKADRAQNIAWADYVALELEAAVKGADITDEQALGAVREYFDKLKVYLDVLEEAEQNRAEEPYPNVEAYRTCLNK